MSAFTQSPASFTNSSDANFRLWGSYIAARFAAVGLVQTADTGQINWTTVLAPVAVSTSAGYEIWRFADALQATAPVYFKITYGSGSTSASNPGMTLIFGSGSDGTGNLTGVLSNTITCQCVASAGATTTWYGSGSTSRFVLGVRASVATAALLLSFERSKDSTGADTSEGVLILTKSLASAANGVIQVAWDCTTGDKSAQLVSALTLMNPTSGVTGTQIATYPFFHTKGVFMYPGMNILAYFRTDIVINSIIGVPFYGATRTYIAMGSGTDFMFAPTTTGGVASSSLGMLIRYE